MRTPRCRMFLPRLCRLVPPGAADDALPRDLSDLYRAGQRRGPADLPPPGRRAFERASGKLADCPAARWPRHARRADLDEILTVGSSPSCCSPATPPTRRSAKFYQTVTEGDHDQQPPAVLHPGLNRLDEATWSKAGRSRAGPWRPAARPSVCPHQLSDELGTARGRSDRATPRSRLFDETIAGMRVLGGEDLTVSAALSKLSDRDRGARAAGGDRRGFGGSAVSLIHQHAGQGQEIIDTWRHYPRPAATATAPDGGGQVVDALVSHPVTGDFPRPQHPLPDEGEMWA